MPEQEPIDPTKILIGREEVLRNQAEVAGPCNRLNGVVTFRHDRCGAGGTLADVRFSEMSETELQAYGPRELTIGPQPTALDLGWLGTDADYIVIHNRAGKHLRRPPSKEEREEIENMVLAVYVDGKATFCVPPRRPFVAAVLPGRQCAIKLAGPRNGPPVPITITAFPR
jgi:hypothetical protein